MRSRPCWKVLIEQAQKVEGFPVNEQETAGRREHDRTGGTKTRRPIVLK